MTNGTDCQAAPLPLATSRNIRNSTALYFGILAAVQLAAAIFMARLNAVGGAPLELERLKHDE
jgi:hypothetical protein